MNEKRINECRRTAVKLLNQIENAGRHLADRRLDEYSNTLKLITEINQKLQLQLDKAFPEQREGLSIIVVSCCASCGEQFSEDIVFCKSCGSSSIVKVSRRTSEILPLRVTPLTKEDLSP